MRIALLQPTYWPEVRRGSERLVHDLGAALASRGHSVTLVTSHRGAPRRSEEDGIRVIRGWRPPERTPLSWYEHHVANIPNAFAHVLRGEYDVAHAFYGPDAWAAVKASRIGGPPVVFSVHGILTRRHLVKRRYRLELIEAAIRDADAVSVLSEAAAVPVRRYFGREPRILPGGVFSRAFTVETSRAPEPTIFCAASLGDPRKRGELLFESFQEVRRAVPNARLLVTRAADPVMSQEPGSLPQGAEWVAADRTNALARLFAAAWVSVLPAVEEAFGLVLLESLAAGTPVIAARSGACPELVPDGAAGTLFEPDDANSLTAAITGALAAPPDHDAQAAARAAAEPWDWGQVVERYEAVYEAVAGR